MGGSRLKSCTSTSGRTCGAGPGQHVGPFRNPCSCRPSPHEAAFRWPRMPWPQSQYAGTRQRSTSPRSRPRHRPRSPRLLIAISSFTPGAGSASSRPWSHPRRPTRRCAGALTEPHSCGYEQLLFAGATEAAQAVGEQLAQLDQAIRKGRVLSGIGASAGINLVMDALNGGATGASKSPPEFLKIDQAVDDLDAQNIWDALQKGETTGDDGGGLARPLWSQLAEYLLSRAWDDPVKSLDRAADRIRLTGLVGRAAAGRGPLPADAPRQAIAPAGEPSAPLLETGVPGSACSHFGGACRHGCRLPGGCISLLRAGPRLDATIRRGRR